MCLNVNFLLVSDQFSYRRLVNMLKEKSYNLKKEGARGSNSDYLLRLLIAGF